MGINSSHKNMGINNTSHTILEIKNTSHTKLGIRIAETLLDHKIHEDSESGRNNSIR